MQFVMLVGIISFIVPMFFLISRRNIRKNGIHTTATVLRTDYKRVPHYVSGSQYRGGSLFTILEFQANGQVVEAQYDAGSSSSKLNEGRNMEIIYHPANPKRIIVKEDGRPVVVVRAVAFMLFGVVLLLIVLWNILN